MIDLRYYPRTLEPVVARLLASFPVVVLTGARQTGKTTLAQHLRSAAERSYRTLDDHRALEVALREPDLLVREAPSMTIDEVQRAPDLLRAIKRAVDADRRPGRYLLTGSANLLLMQKVSESLAGRAVYLQLGPMTPREIGGGGEDGGPWTALLQADDVTEADRTLRKRPALQTAWERLALQGGYPPLLDLDAEARGRWLEGYVSTYLERDLRQLSAIESLTGFRRLMQVAALRMGGLLNQADLARDAGLSRPTAHRYLSLLETSFQLRPLPPYATNRTKRVVKAPKLYWGDSGLCATLAGLDDPAELRGLGAYLEALLLRDLDTWRETVTPRPALHHYRSADGAEVDFVVEQRRRLLPIEVKASTQVGGRDIRHLDLFLGRHKAAPFGLLAYGGDELYRVSSRVLAVPVSRLLG